MKHILTTVLTLLVGTTTVFAESFVIRNVTVLPMTGEESLANRHVFLEDGRITAVTEKANSIPKTATSIDGTGKFLIPGLWDVHVHLSFWDEPDADDAPPARNPDPDAYRQVLGQLAAWGVTSVRDMGGDLDAIDHWRERIEKGEVVGPTVFRAVHRRAQAERQVPDVRYQRR